MDPTALANLIASLIPTAISVYNEIRASNQNTLPPIAQILAAADADWDEVAKLAQQQLAANQQSS